MGVVFVGGAWEFLSYSLNMGRFPYKVRWITKSNTASEELRFAADLLVATTYGLLLIQAYGLWLDPSRGLFWFFDTLVLIDLLSLASVVLGEVQWQIPRYRIFAELPFILLLLAWYQNEFHGADASLNRRFLAYTIVFIFVRELFGGLRPRTTLGRVRVASPSGSDSEGERRSDQMSRKPPLMLRVSIWPDRWASSLMAKPSTTSS